jgi:hydrogenase maturation protease
MKKIFLGGIGNVLLQDDGIGPLVVRTLAAEYQFSNYVEVEDLGTPGLELAGYLAGKDVVILIDSVTSEHSPGTILLFRKPQILAGQAPLRTGSHAPSLLEALLTFDLIGAAPEQLLLIGVVGQSHEMGHRMSDPVRMSVQTVGAAVLDELRRLHVSFKARQSCIPPDIWWEKENNNIAPSADLE